MIEASQAEILSSLRKKFNRSILEGRGCAFVLGESGIGKTAVVVHFIKSVSDDTLAVRVSGRPTPQQSYTSVYEALYNSVVGRRLNQEQVIELLRKYIQLLPGFGTYVAPLVTHTRMDSVASLFKRAGFTEGINPSLHIARFIENLAGTRKILFIVDNAQWLDTASLDCIISILHSTSDSRWFILFLYNNRIESWNPEANRQLSLQIEDQLRQTQQHQCILQVARWPKAYLNRLCAEILGASCSLGEERLEELYQISEGIPFYVKSVLSTLQQLGHIHITSGTAVIDGEWKIKDICRSLRDAVISRLKRLYAAVPDSRTAMEVASVLGYTFSDQHIDGVLSIRDSCQVLFQIEQQFWLIRYGVESRSWQFDHNLVRETVYRSLGSLSKKIHLDVAEFLQQNDPDACLTISHHYDHAGEFLLSKRWIMREVERLLNCGLSSPASALMSQLWQELQEGRMTYPDDDLWNLYFLWGKCHYYARSFEMAFDHFNRVLNGHSDKLHSAIVLHWIAKCLMKRARQSDLQDALVHLQDALVILQAEGDSANCANLLVDLLVAAAHVNDFDRASAAFKEAEKIYRERSDRVGMARLQCKCVLVYESTLSAPILERLADSFGQLQLQRDRIMCLNNAATAYIELRNFEKSARLLQLATIASKELEDFGVSYLYNNRGIIQLLQGDPVAAESLFQSARINSVRDVERLITNMNRAVAQALMGDTEVANIIFMKCLAEATNTGELVYVLPCLLNASRLRLRSGEFQEAVDLLRNYMPDENSNWYLDSYNELWYRQNVEALERLNDSERLLSFRQSSHRVGQGKELLLHVEGFVPIDMQFWSD